MMPSSNNQRSYSRFIPSEEVGDFKQWKFSAVDGSDLVEPTPEPVAEIPVEVDEAELQAQQALLQQQACDDAYAEGFAQGQAQTALEWQRRMDEYIAQQGHETAQRLQSVVQTLDASLIDMQQQMAQQLLELACDIARQVVRQELSVNPNALQPVVREAVGMLVTEGRPAVVRLNPADMEAMAQPLREEIDALESRQAELTHDLVVLKTSSQKQIEQLQSSQKKLRRALAITAAFLCLALGGPDRPLQVSAATWLGRTFGHPDVKHPLGRRHAGRGRLGAADSAVGPAPGRARLQPVLAAGTPTQPPQSRSPFAAAHP